MKLSAIRLGFSVSLGLGLALALLWLLSSRPPGAGAAGPWFVDPAGDDGFDCLSTGSACATLAGAVGKASSGDTINLAAGTYTENVTISGKTLTLVGAGAASTIVDGSGAGRVIETDSDLTLMDLTLQNGSAPAGDGGGLYATAAITLTNVNVLSSTAFFNGGGVYATGPATLAGGRIEANAGSQGGGVYAVSTLTLSGTQLIGNTADSWGGGARAEQAVSVSGGLFQDNGAGSGAGLFAGASLTVTGTQFMTNTAADFGGGLYGAASAGVEAAVFAGNQANTGGGAHFDGAATVTGTQFITNTAAGGGGGAYFNAVAEVTGTMFTQNAAGTGAFGGGAVFAYTATVTGGGFVSNTTQFAGGGAYFDDTTAIVGTAFTGNTAQTNRGGGAYFDNPAILVDATFTANQTPVDRGAGAYFRAAAWLTGTDFVENLSADRGGGAYFFASAALTGTHFLSNTAGTHGGGGYFNSSFEVMDSVFISNTAVNGFGGGAFQGGTGNGRLTNGLFTRNTSADAGNDLHLGSSGAATVLHTTLANAAAQPGAAIFVNAGSIAVTNTLFANYQGGLVITPTGVTASSDYNLFYNAPTNVVTGTHSLTGTNPLFVNPAFDNYHLGNGSPAAGAGANLGTATDLDGNPRGDPPSMGAYELPALLISLGGAPSLAPTGQTITYTLLVTNTDPNPATTVQVTDTLDAGTTFVALSAPAGWSCTTPSVGATGQVLCGAASLNASATAAFTLTVRLGDFLAPGALVTNTATITSDQFNPTPPSQATAVTQIYPYRFYWPVYFR